MNDTLARAVRATTGAWTQLTRLDGTDLDVVFDAGHAMAETAKLLVDDHLRILGQLSEARGLECGHDPDALGDLVAAVRMEHSDHHAGSWSDCPHRICVLAATVGP